MNGSTVKNHISFRNGIRIQCNTENFVPIVVPGLSTSSSSGSHHSTSMTPSRQEKCIVLHLFQARLHHHPESEIQTREREDRIESDISPVQESISVDDSGRTSSEIPEWLQEFRVNLVDDEIPLQGSSHASSSHEVSLEPTFKRREDLGKHSVYTHVPKDRNCEICHRTKITSSPCRRRNDGVVPRAENFDDLITADHKILIDNCESRDNH